MSPASRPGVPGPPEVVVYTRSPCGLCEKAERLVVDEAGAARVRFLDIDRDPQLQRRYHVRVPVVVVDGREVAAGQIASGTVAGALRRARLSRLLDRWLPWRGG